MKKVLRVILIILAIIVLLAVIFFGVDYSRVNKGKQPMFCILKNEINDGGTKIYLGLGYKVIDFHTLAGFNAVKIGNWFMKYEDFDSEMKKYEIKTEKENKCYYSKTIDNTTIELNIPSEWNYEEIPKDEENNFYKYALKLYKNNKDQYAMLYFENNPFGVCGTGRTAEKITLNNGKEAIIGYYDENKNWSDISFYEINKYIGILNYGLINNDAKEITEVIKTINIINEYSFCGTITQVEDNLFFVEPDKNEEIRKSADKIMVGKLKLDTNVKFEVGERIKITYDGDVMETYPAQIKAIKYESLSANN